MESVPKRIALILITAFLVGPSGVDAQRSQTWRTGEGKLYFGDTPPPGSEPVGEVERDRPVGTSPARKESAGGAPGAGPSMDQERLSALLDEGFEIERVSLGQGQATAVLGFRNVTSVPLERVWFECTALGEGGQEIATGKAELPSSGESAIPPGFEGTREVRIELGVQELKSLDCRVTAAVG